MLDMFGSFGGKLRNKHCGITAVRFGYNKLRAGEPVFDGMCYISFANEQLLNAFISQFNGYYFDEKAERGGHALRVVVSDTQLDAGTANRSRVLGGMRMDADIEDCPSNTRIQQVYEDRFKNQ